MRFRWVVLLAVLTAGCATTKNQASVQELQIRVGELERELQMKDEQIGSLEGQMRDMSYEAERAKSRPQSSSRYEEMARVSNSSSSSRSQDDDEIIRVNATAQQVQTALQNAGYYKGNIDGKVGLGTKSAISQFQKDHGLNPDGLVGRKTWTELQPFLER